MKFNKILQIALSIIIVITLFSCGNSHDGKYFFKDSNVHLQIELSGDVLTMKEILENGKTRENFEYKGNYHINEENVILLDKMLKGRDSLQFQTAWNNVKIGINDGGIEFYEDFDRNDDKMFFTKVK